MDYVMCPKTKSHYVYKDVNEKAPVTQLLYLLLSPPCFVLTLSVLHYTSGWKGLPGENIRLITINSVPNYWIGFFLTQLP